MTGAIATVLIVEDEASIRLSVEISLRSLPVRCITAENGQQALDLVDADPPDLILLDVMMPVMNGYQFLRSYRQRYGHATPVIVITAKYDSIDLYWSKKFAITEYIQKPFESGQLRRAVEKALAASPAPDPSLP
jgi:CheY-like chemotaxis protein